MMCEMKAWVDKDTGEFALNSPYPLRIFVVREPDGEITCTHTSKGAALECKNYREGRTLSMERLWTFEESTREDTQ